MRRKVDELEAEKREMSEAVDDAFKERELSGMDFVYFSLQIQCGTDPVLLGYFVDRDRSLIVAN